MEFTQKKLPAEAAPRMRLCPIHTVKPHALMLAPVYVFMKLNEKFVAVKGPLDFFTEQELERLRPFEAFFIPDFVESTQPFRQAARTVKTILGWKSELAVKEGEEYPHEPLSPAPYELSDAVLRLLGPLWVQTAEHGPVIEPFFVAVFANELCELLPGDLLKQSRDASVERYEKAILLSSWCVFLALHLGYCELGFLNELRRRIFVETVEGAGGAGIVELPEVAELVGAAKASMEGRQRERVSPDYFLGRQSRVAQKIVSRVERIKKSYIDKSGLVSTIHGLKGFVDV